MSSGLCSKTAALLNVSLKEACISKYFNIKINRKHGFHKVLHTYIHTPQRVPFFNLS